MKRFRETAMPEKELDKKTLLFAKHCIQRIDPLMEDLLRDYSGRRFWKAIKHQIGTGGKRLRPVFLFISCNLLGGKEKDADYAAAAMELMHNYTLIVDDIIDHSDVRRGKPTVWKSYGKSIAQCIGVHYSAAVFEGASRSPNPLVVLNIMSNAMKEVVEGEIIDILQERVGKEEEPFVKEKRYKKVDLKDYLDMISRKTAIMFEASCKIGGICAGGSKKEVELLGEYGHNIGISFQISDDILDIFGEEKEFGKKIGKDIEERKGGNIMVLFALSMLEPKKKKELEKILEKSIIKEADLKRAVLLIRESGAEEKAHAFGEEYVKKAKETLHLLPDNKWRSMIDNLSEYIISRRK